MKQESISKINMFSDSYSITFFYEPYCGTKDEIVSFKQSEKLARLYNFKLEAIESANHRYTKIEDVEKIVTLSVNWFSKWLK